LNNFFASRYKKVADKRIFKEFLITIKKEGRDKIVDFLKYLKDDSKIYNSITKPKQDDWGKLDYDIFESINAITTVFKIEVANTFLISLIRDYQQDKISKNYLLNALHSIEKFHFINNAICSNRSSGFDRMYAKRAKQLFEALDKEKKHRVINEVNADLKDKTPDIDPFRANFDKKIYYSSTNQKQKSLVQYVLNIIERKLNSNAILINTSIEHIYPEKPNDKWNKLSDNKLIQNIGNLVLLDKELNSKIGNKDYLTKQNMILNKSQILSTKNVFENQQWGDNEIIKRRDALINELYTNVWT
jgi:hypothetical protein